MLQKVIRSYLYQQYADDEDLQAFVAWFNAEGQEYVGWFASISLPVYTGPGAVCPGLYQSLGRSTRCNLSRRQRQSAEL